MNQAHRPAEPPIDSLYCDPLHYDLLAQMTAPEDLPFYFKQIGEDRGTLLELGCGTGRLSLPLSARVDQLTAVDNAPEMLSLAQAKAQACPIEFVLANFVDFDLARVFDWILLPYNALNHVIDAKDIRSLFGTVRRHLSEGGRFIVDTFQPDPAALGRPPRRTRLLTYRDPVSAERVTMHEENCYDPASQVNRVTWSYDIGALREARIDVTHMRIFFPQELDALFDHHGFVIEAKFGDYDGSPFGSTSPKQLVVARRR